MASYDVASDIRVGPTLSSSTPTPSSASSAAVALFLLELIRLTRGLRGSASGELGRGSGPVPDFLGWRRRLLAAAMRGGMAPERRPRRYP